MRKSIIFIIITSSTINVIAVIHIVFIIDPSNPRAVHGHAELLIFYMKLSTSQCFICTIKFKFSTF